MPENQNAIIKRGILYAHDEVAKTIVKIAYVEDLTFTNAQNQVDVVATSGYVLQSFVDPRASITGTLYTPGDNKLLELMFRGSVTNVKVNGSTAIAGNVAVIKFPASATSVVLPLFNGAKTAVTVTHIKNTANPSTTYTLTTDYTVTVDSATGLTMINHVGAGTIPVDTEVTVTYDATPLASNVLQPVVGGVLRPRTFIIHEEGADATKYRRLVLPDAVATTDIELPFLNISSDNASPNVLNFTFTQQKRDIGTKNINWALIDTINAA